MRSRSAPARARAIWASTMPNLTPRLKRDPAGLQRQISLATGQGIHRGGELDRAQLADVAADQVVEQLEDRRRQQVHAEEAEEMPRAEAGHLEPQLGQRGVGLLDDLVDDVDLGMLRLPAAGDRPVLVDQVLPGGLHGGDGAPLGRGQLDQLAGASPGLGGDVHMIAQQQEAGLIAGERPGAPDGMAVALGLGLDGELQPLLEVDEPSRLLLGPLELPGRLEECGVVAELLAIDGLVARAHTTQISSIPLSMASSAMIWSTGLVEPVAVDKRQHRLLHGVGDRILPRPAAGRRDHRLGHLHDSSPLPVARLVVPAWRTPFSRPGFPYTREALD